MSLCNIKCVERIARYLNVPEKLLFDKNVFNPVQDVPGFGTIVQTLVRSSNSDVHFDNEIATRSLIRQWLEYIVVCMNHADVPANTKKVLNELNTVLKNLTYIGGTKKTIADIVLYYVLHSIMAELSHQQKARYIHVSRWFDNIQQEEKLRQELDLISFNLLHVFL